MILAAGEGSNSRVELTVTELQDQTQGDTYFHPQYQVQILHSERLPRGILAICAANHRIPSRTRGQTTISQCFTTFLSYSTTGTL